MTPVQKGRLAGFNASLRERGVTLGLAGSDATLVALVEDSGPTSEEMEASTEVRMFANLHLLPSANVSALRYGVRLHDADLNRDFIITKRMPHDIWTVFRTQVVKL